jgi:uncharacterized protein YdeI (YjbR/CyaY-like superfamily)
LTDSLSGTSPNDMKRHKTVDDYVASREIWQCEIKRLREILLSTDLAEEVKWGGPCYACDGQNLVGIGGFKSYFGLWFHQGALLQDKNKVLINAQEGTTKALRQWRMQSAKDIKPATIKAYAKEAIELTKAGKKIGPQKKKPIVVPPELKKAFAKNDKAKKAYAALRPGLQREYTDHVASAKREETKQKRIENILPMISTGKGLHDKYR